MSGPEGGGGGGMRRLPVWAQVVLLGLFGAVTRGQGTLAKPPPVHR